MAEFSAPAVLATPGADDIPFNRDDGVDGWQITSIDGLDQPTIRTGVVEDMPQTDAPLLHPMYEGGRYPVIAAQWDIISGDFADRNLACQALVAALRSIRFLDGYGGSAVGTWTWAETGLDTQQIEVVCYAPAALTGKVPKLVTFGLLATTNEITNP